MKKKKAPLPQLKASTSLIDTHCHLDMERYADNLDEVVLSAAEKGVKRIITIGIDAASSRAAVTLAKRYSNIWATVGFHPHNADAGDAETFDQLARLAEDPANKVVGYGEIGLDYARNYAPRDTQLKTFSGQLDIAKSLNLPIIIHDRDAHEETMQILKRFAPFPNSGVMHCFSGDMELAHQIMDIGFHISIPGIVTFNKSEMMQQVAREVPIERLILETDGPFLAPVPYRGRTNRPEYLLYTAQKVADLRSLSLDEIAEQTTRNAEHLFGLQTPEMLS